MDTNKRKAPGIQIPMGEVRARGVVVRRADKEHLGENVARKRATAHDKCRVERPTR